MPMVPKLEMDVLTGVDENSMESHWVQQGTLGEFLVFACDRFALFVFKCSERLFRRDSPG